MNGNGQTSIQQHSVKVSCSAVSKFMIRLLRHEKNIPREDDGAVRVDDLIEEFKVKFVGTLLWIVDAWVSFLAKGGEKKRFQYCLNPSSDKFLYFRAVQGHIREVILLIHCCKTMYCCWMTLQSTSTTSGTLSKCTPLSKVDWSQEEKASEGTGSQCSSQP